MTKQEAIELARNAVLNGRKMRKTVRVRRSSLTPSEKKRYEKVFPPGFILKPDLEHPTAVKRGSEWCVRFDFILPPGVIRLPSSRCVWIDDVTGKVTIPLNC